MSLRGGVAVSLGAGVVCLLLTVLAVAQFMPGLLGTILLVWLAVSIPIGIAVGHCALSSDD